MATFFNNFLPSNIGGDVIRVRDSSRDHRHPRPTSLAVVAIDRILGFGALYVLALAGLPAGPARAARPGRRRAALLAVLGACSSACWPTSSSGPAPRAGSWPRPAWRSIAVGRASGSRSCRPRSTSTARSWRAVWLAFGASVALQALVVFYYYDVAHSLRIPLPLSACFLMVPLCILVQTVPISFNGWGIRESVFILYFRQLGLPRESALAFSLVGAGLIVLLSLLGRDRVDVARTRPAQPPQPSR